MEGKRVSPLLLAAVCAALAVPVLSSPAGGQTAVGPTRIPASFRSVAWQAHSDGLSGAGNTYGALRAGLRRKVSAVEVDLRLAADGVLVTAHDETLPGCGWVHSRTSRSLKGCRLQKGLRIASLDEVLRLPYREIYLDLKDTMGPDYHGSGRQVRGWSEGKGARAVSEAADAIVRSRRADDVVLLVYDRLSPSETSDIADEIQRRGLRAGIKAYPSSPVDSERLPVLASSLGFELVCVNIGFTSEALIREAAALDVWYLVWDVGGAHLPEWKHLARWGLGGLISRYFHRVRDDVAPQYRRAPAGSPL